MSRAEVLIKRIRTRHGLDESRPVGIKAVRMKLDEIDMDAQEVSVIANTDEIDMDQEVLWPAGAREDSYFFRNKALFIDHNLETRFSPGVMRSVSKIMAGGKAVGWKVRKKFYSTPLGKDIFTMCVEGNLGSSVGYLAEDEGPPSLSEKSLRPGLAWSIRGWDWLEQTCTAIPCNVSARTVGGGEPDGKALGMLDELCTKNRIRRETGELLGLPPRKVILRKVLMLSE